MSKKTIRVPVSAFTFKIVTSRYGHPLNITMHSHKELVTFLQVQSVFPAQKSKTILVKELVVTLPSSIGVALAKRNLKDIGVSLHQLYQLKLYDYIVAQIQTGEGKNTAYGALKDFFNRHSIDDDDFSFESAYRGWLRYQSNIAKNLAIFDKSALRNPLKIVSENIAQIEARTEGNPTTSKSIHYAIRQNARLYPEFFQNDYHKRVLRIYLLRRLCKFSFRQIAQRVKTGESTVRYHDRQFEKRIFKNQQLRIATEIVTEYLSNCKITVLLPRRKAV